MLRRRCAGCLVCQWEDIAAAFAAIDLEFPRSVAGWRNREIVACHGRRTREHGPPALARRQVRYRGKAVAIQAR
jgi:hypothetical protein